jgi:ubiquinone/menaquinone biosynthesis C-methylase UbiE
MIEAIAPTDKIIRAYNYASAFYGPLIAPFERKPRMRGLELAAIQPTDTVLEVAVGPGATFVEILKRVERTNTVYGVDIAPKMLAKTRQVARAAGFSNVDLRVADAHHLPFPDGMFDVLYNSYMFDLMPLKEMPLLLAEFKRVLKPTGRLVLVNMSKPDDAGVTGFEHLYMRLPRRLVPYLLGGCRPVLLEPVLAGAGFTEIRREFMRHTMPSEIVLAKKA